MITRCSRESSTTY